MKLYNVEFFDTDFNYIGSQQVGDFSAEYDYLSPTNNKLNLLKSTDVEINNLMLITSMQSNEQYPGIVTDVKLKKDIKQVEFKPLISIFDVDVMHGNVTIIEQWLKAKIDETFVENADTYQNYSMIVNTTTSTAGDLDTEEPVINLYEAIVYTLKKYSIAINMTLDMLNKRIVVQIGQVPETIKTIETDLPNILDTNISIKDQGSNALNKITIMNVSEEGAGEQVIYYRDKSGNVTQTPSERIVPVVFKIITLDATSEEFNDKALEEATSQLAVEEYNNLIELKIKENDELIEAEKMQIGQKVEIIANGKSYRSVFTGIKVNNGTELLMFGAIRLELTKILKRRLKNERN